MRIGFDVDGVLAAFIPRYEEMFVKEVGRNDFPPLDHDGPPTWDWPSLYGYTNSETKAVWARIKTNSVFWRSLEQTPDFELFRQWHSSRISNGQRGKDEIYFITNRPGMRPKHQTEEWFFDHLGETPTVLISEHKGLIAAALNLDFYIDDNAENIKSVEELAPKCRGYLLDRQYNRHLSTKHRIASLEEFLQVVNSN